MSHWQSIQYFAATVLKVKAVAVSLSLVAGDTI